MAFFPMPAWPVELDAGLRPQLRGDLADDRRPADRLGLAQRAEDGDLLGPQFGEVMDLGGVAGHLKLHGGGGAAGGGIAGAGIAGGAPGDGRPAGLRPPGKLRHVRRCFP